MSALPNAGRVKRASVGVVLLAGVACVDQPPGMLEVTVLRDSPPVPASGANVTISGFALAQSADPTGKATFALITAGTYQVHATLIGYCPATGSATVSEGATTNLTLSLGTGPCPTDQISTGGAEAFYGLVDVRTGAASPCENDRLVEGAAGTADLATNALELTAGGFTCHGASWLFTTDHAPAFSNNPANFPWTNASGDLVTQSLPAGQLRVPVTIWMSDATIDEGAYRTTMTDEDLPQANDFLWETRSGLRLTSSETGDGLPEIVDVGTLTDPNTGAAPYPLIGNGCRNAWQITASPVIYHSDHINVYVVELIDGDGIAAGRNCRENGAANVIFIDDDANYVTLVHEIGHALALTRPMWGHVDNIKGMYPDNVMWTGATVAGHVSLGQIVRMHADTWSWINEVTGAGSVRDRQFPGAMVTSCSCPGVAATDDCPQVDRDIARVGVSNTGITNAACHVITDVSCLALATGATGQVRADGFTSSSMTTMGVGEGIVSSLAPAVATAAKPALGGEGPGFVRAEVTAGPNPGNTQVLMWLGGTSKAVMVKVGAGVSCP